MDLLTKLPEGVTPQEIAEDSRWAFAVEVVRTSMPQTGPASSVLRWIDTIEAIAEADRNMKEKI